MSLLRSRVALATLLVLPLLQACFSEPMPMEPQPGGWTCQPGSPTCDEPTDILMQSLTAHDAAAVPRSRGSV